jgi:hypothetical protein
VPAERLTSRICRSSSTHLLNSGVPETRPREAAAIGELLLEIDLLGRGFASREQESGADQQGE